MTKVVNRSGFLVLAVVIVALLVAACSGAEPTSYPTYTPASTYTPYPTLTPAATATTKPTVSPTLYPTYTPPATYTPYPTLTPAATATTKPTVAPTSTPTATPLPARKLAYIANVMPPTISILDLDNLTLVDSIVFRDLATKQQGHFLSVSPDGKNLWISEDISDNGGFVQVVDLRTGAVVQKWDVGAGVGNYISRDGRYVFTSSTKTKKINVFDVANVKYLGDFPIGAAPHVFDSSPDGKVLWTTDAGGGNLRSFDISGLPDKLPTPLDTIKIGGALHAVAVHPNGKYVFVGSAESGDNVVDVATKTIVARVPGKPHNYDISPDRKYLLSGENDYPT